MSTLHTSTRRDSATTLTEDASNISEKMATYMSRVECFDGDDKTLSNVSLRETSSSTYSQTKLSKAMTKLKSKLTAKDEKPKQKASIPPDYYPSTLQTFAAIAAARM
ncbi:hypothetical protein F4825DRAFT_430228 [Nemania diffusa]|nr:hypothetical protein F4825DRAFT_430228 [Nemania diffusa]